MKKAVARAMEMTKGAMKVADDHPTTGAWVKP